ncbi:MAG TPA: hypothetical protein VMX17_08795 [Candidatus Glassbacteria bacterium]|nr:hypothetical protein [Candidatus Glassbacteria bacterium]
MSKKRKISPHLTNLQSFSRVGEPSSMLTTDLMNKQKIERLKSWTTFYRKNPSFFIEHYMGVQLYPYQRFWVNLICRCTEFLGIASRASAKSWLVAVFSIARCILYPGTTIALASSTKAQAGLIISEKCKILHDDHPNIARETENITTNMNKWEMAFKNNSKIQVVVSGESGRGHRSNITVLEERRLIPNAIIDAIIRPFLVSRQPPYMKKAEYAQLEELREEPLEIIITSSHYKSAEWYPEAKKFLRLIAAGDPDTKCIFLDYPISLRHGIKTKKQMIREKENLDPITFTMEYENIAVGDSAKSFYKMALFNRTVKRSWRPITDEGYIITKKNNYDIIKLPEEMRIVSVDIAMRAGSTNDNTIISCARLLPSRKGWLTEICYMESHNGKNTALQALRIKQIFEEFQGDILVLDLANAGISVFDALSSVTKDEQRGVEYEALTVMPSPYVDNKVYEELKDRTLGQDARGCIFPISATAALNSAIAVKFRERLKKKLVTFLVDDSLEEEFLIKSKNKDILIQDNSTIRAYLLQAHIQTSLFVNESIALEMVMLNGLIKLVEPEGARKDRYTSVSYLNYYVSLMDLDLLQDRYTKDEDEAAFLGVTMIG